MKLTATLRSKATGQAVTLGAELARGGEGVVFGIQGAPKDVAKVYLKPPNAEKSAKLAAMALGGSSELLKVAAWPTDVLLDGRSQVAGFVMPRITTRSDAHELYSPRSRVQAFPEADFRFLVHVAGNVARAFAVVHAAGHVIGDINHGHMLVGPDGRVVLIDADSFQVKLGGKTYLCDVGVPLFTAPELQGLPFKGMTRTQNHDLFGLGVMLFHILMMGRHPFAGVWSGPGDMPIERAIREGRFAYGQRAAQFQMKRPPGTIPLEVLGPSVAVLFEQAFAPGAAARPQARAWLAALELLKSSLVSCGRDAAHFHPRQAAACPWCEVESSGVRLFGHRIERHAASVAGFPTIEALWATIERAPAPPPEPRGYWQQAWTPPPGFDVPRDATKAVRKAFAIGFGLLGLSSCVAAQSGTTPWWLFFLLMIVAYGTWPRPPKEKVLAADRAINESKQQWQALLDRWNREASGQPFQVAKESLRKAYSDLQALPGERQRKLGQLKSQQQEFQRRRHLDRFRINRASISGIGPGRAATLASFGVETAADVSRRAVMQIPGFGETLTATLLAWRHSHEANFRFNPNEPIDPAEINRVEADVLSRQRALTSTLQDGSRRLSGLSAEIVSARRRLEPLMKDAWDRFKIAEAKRRAL